VIELRWLHRIPVFSLKRRVRFGDAVFGPRDLVGIALADEATSTAIVAFDQD
jgi:hypothetical protein